VEYRSRRRPVFPFVELERFISIVSIYANCFCSHLLVAIIVLFVVDSLLVMVAPDVEPYLRWGFDCRLDVAEDLFNSGEVVDVLCRSVAARPDKVKQVYSHDSEIVLFNKNAQGNSSVEGAHQKE